MLKLTSPIILAVLVGSTPSVSDRIEISDDGHEAVVVDLSEPAGGVAGVSAVPYGAAPDWANALRRQVGALQAVDMNGDDLVDVVAGVYHSDSFPPYDDWHNLIYYNIGGALEADPSWISDDEVSTGDIQVALLNGDAYPDVFAANGGFAMDPSVIYFGGPGGPATAPGWSSAEPGNAWNNYALPYDLDHDGDVDVITANQGNSQFDPYRPIYVFRNTGGALATVPDWQSAESSIQNGLSMADFDGNGWEDLAVSKWSNFESGVYANGAAGLHASPSWTTGDTDTDKGVGWADVDGNGWPDLALGHDPTQLFANDAGALAPAWSASGSYFGHSELRFTDVDGDGDQDLAEVHFSNGHVNIYLNEAGVLSTAPSWTYDAPSVGTAIAFGDISGNGRLDLIVGTSGEPSIVVFYAEDLAPCPGDADGNGQVDVTDLLGLLGAWGTSNPDYDIAPAGGDGIVNVADLLALLAAWGPCL